MFWKSCRHKCYILRVFLFRSMQHTLQQYASTKLQYQRNSWTPPLWVTLLHQIKHPLMVSKGKQAFDRSDEPFPCKSLFKNKTD